MGHLRRGVWVVPAAGERWRSHGWSWTSGLRSLPGILFLFLKDSRERLCHRDAAAVPLREAAVPLWSPPLTLPGADTEICLCLVPGLIRGRARGKRPHSIRSLVGGYRGGSPRCHHGAAEPHE